MDEGLKKGKKQMMIIMKGEIKRMKYREGRKGIKKMEIQIKYELGK
jgi:hypothetical protein